MHSETYPYRDVRSIRRKFTSLHRRNIPTGDPDCPEEVKLAKRVFYLLGQKAAVGDGEEEFELEVQMVWNLAFQLVVLMVT